MGGVFVAKETVDGERRVAATPETVRKLVDRGATVRVARGAGEGAHFDDRTFEEAGAEVVKDAASALADAQVVLRVGPLSSADAERLTPGALVISFCWPLDHLDLVRVAVRRRTTYLSMNLVPRISRAQRMDALSSQASIGGYKAALLAAAQLPKYFPLLMTAAGTVKPAKVVVMGAGVAGLQAIATARRLGAQVWASDVRLAAKEQVESLGAKFIDVPGMEEMEDRGGYARAADEAFLQRQRTIVAEQVSQADVVITTALVPGKRAPLLIPSALLRRMRPGSVVVDLAASQGGNCEESEPGETVVRHGVTIIAPENLPGTLAVHASELYARNVLALLLLMFGEEQTVVFDPQDEVLAGCAVTHDGRVLHQPTVEALEGRSTDAGRGAEGC